MILNMIDNSGRARIGEFVRKAIAWKQTSAVKVGAMPGRPSRETIQRIVAGEEVSEVSLLALGTKLGLPADYLIYVGTGDIRRIRRSGADPDLIRVTVDLIEPDEFDAGYHRAQE
jgi:hypothetical protein